MPAEAMPPTGGPPPDGVKTCDASGMAMIHRVFRVGFGEGPDLVGRVAAGDTAHAEAVAAQLNMLSVGLHAHHEGEDERLWGPLEQRAPSCAEHVGRMKQQHAEMLTHLHALDAALPAWRATATGPEAVLQALDGINAALAVHLPDEEENIVPVMETTITEREAQWFSEHGRKATPKGQTWNMIGTLLRAQPDPDATLREDFPAPFRLVWRVIGKPRYEKNRVVLEGRRP
ncbi:hemerythrin domain-containing protein [Microbacter sp. GSS18]|nr:hemerythrin domain-containing protein [Microbacter sp. GSS18]